MVEGIVYTGYARNSRFYIKWWRTSIWNNSSNCGSNINWELHLENNNQWYSNALGINAIEINGKQVYGSNTWSNYKTKGDYVLASGNTQVQHNNDGTKKITVLLKGWFYQHGEKSGQNEFTLDNIARAPEFEIQPYQLVADDETIMKIFYKPSKTLSSVQYRMIVEGNEWEYAEWQNIDVINGEWNSTDGCTFKVYSMASSFDGSAITYYLQMRIMSDENGIWKESKVIAIKPLAKPNFINFKDKQTFKIGDIITLNFSNPLNRTLILIINNNEKKIKEYKFKGTTFSGINEADFIEEFYKISAKNKSTKVEFELGLMFEYGNEIEFSNMKNIVINCNGSEKPKLEYFDFYDDNKDVVFWTGSNDIIIQGLSNLKARVMHENKMQTQKYAVADHYKFGYGNIEKSIDSNISGDIIADFGIPTSSGNYKITATAVDSRKMETTLSKELKIYEYHKPILYVFGERKNHFEDETEISINGKISEILVNGTNKNAIQKIEYRYRADYGNFTPWKQLVVSSVDTEFRLPKLFLNLDSEKSFDIEVQVTDNFKTTIEKLRIDSGKSIFSIRTDGNCYVGDDKVTTERWNGAYSAEGHSNLEFCSGGRIQTKPEVLFSNWNGDNSDTITLNKNIYNYNRLLIYYKDTVRHHVTSKIVSARNSLTTLDTLSTHGDNIRMTARTYLINNTTLQSTKSLVILLPANTRYEANELAILEIDGIK